MKKFLSVLLVVTMIVMVSSTAFGYTLYGFEKPKNASMWQEHWYTDCTLRHVTAELSTEQVKSGTSSMKITAPAGEEEFAQFGIWCDKSYLTFVTNDMVFDCDIYIPEDSNVSRVVFYICDDSWDYFAFGEYTPEEWDTWVSLSEVYDYLYYADYADNDGVMPAYFIIECDTIDNTEDAYFYVDNFYFGTEADRDAAFQGGEKVDIPVQSTEDVTTDVTEDATTDVPGTNNNTTGNEGDSNDMTMWIIVGAVVAVAVVAAVVVIVVAKKKK